LLKTSRDAQEVKMPRTCRNKRRSGLRNVTKNVSLGTMDPSTALLPMSGFVDLGPGVFEGHSPIEDQVAGRGIGVHTKIPLSLKLKACSDLG
jgi:hypothetical protein